MFDIIPYNYYTKDEGRVLKIMHIRMPKFKNHIGNICAVVNSMQDTAVQSTLYYASGVPLARSFGRDVQPYLYNGKEFIEAHGLNEYDSKARMYYAPIMRTTTMDPLCEKYYNLSPYAWCGNNLVNVVDVNGDSIQLGDNAIEVIMAIYNGLGNDASITLSFQNGILIPDNLKSIPSFDDNIFLQDLYELAIHPQMIEISSSVNNTYIMNGKLHQDNFSPPIIDDISSFSPEEQKQLRDLNYPEGRLIYGNLGQSLFPIKSSGKRSTNQNIQIILNAYSNLEVMTIGLAHEFAHVVLFLRGLPYRHGEANVDQFIFSREKPFYIKFGYDF